MSGHHHERLVCKCGAVIAQCRCMEPKTDRIAAQDCSACQEKARTTTIAHPVAYAEEPGRDYRKERDAAYTERNRLVAALARLMIQASPIRPAAAPAAAWLSQHDPFDAGWDPEWRTIVFIETTVGQLSFHLHDSDVPLFDGLPRGPNLWDGHTTPEKYKRVARLGR